MPTKYKAKYSGRIYANRNDAINDNVSYLKAKRLTEQTNKIPLRYIGGTPNKARAEFWRQEPVMQHAVDSIAGRYGISSDALKYRLNAEGFVDDQISYRNYALKNNGIIFRGYENLHDYSPGISFGLDDARDYIDSGKVQLINEKWYDANDFINEQGRTTHPVNGETTADNIGIMAAHLKYFKEQAKKDYPNTNENDLNRYALAYYNRGIEGGRKWVKSGAKGYNYKRSLEEGGK